MLSEAISPVLVAEGVADALALASRNAGPAVATLGTSGMADEGGGALVEWLAKSVSGVVIHADADAGGEQNARQLRRQLTIIGEPVRAVIPAQGKDAADAAADLTFPELTEGWESYAKTLAETTTCKRRRENVPRGRSYRLIWMLLSSQGLGQFATRGFRGSYGTPLQGLGILEYGEEAVRSTGRGESGEGAIEGKALYQGAISKAEWSAFRGLEG